MKIISNKYQFHLKYMLILSVVLGVLKVMKVLTQKKYQDHVPCSFAYNVACIGYRSFKPIVAFRGENATYEFIKAILKEYTHCKKTL